MRYKIHYVDRDIYEIKDLKAEHQMYSCVYAGSILECEAWLRLKKEGYFD